MPKLPTPLSNFAIGLKPASFPIAHLDHSSMSILTFIERRFIPQHVQFKSLAGRIHYRSILKHIVTPESVDHLFAMNLAPTTKRLKTIQEWPYLDEVNISDLNPGHVQRLVTAAVARGYSPQTVKHIKNVLGAIVAHARRESLFRGENPVSNVALPPMVRKTAHNLTILQAKSILRILAYPEREIALFTMTTGMSVADICSLRWRCVNLSASTVMVDEHAVPPASLLVNKTGGRKHYRSIGIPASFVQILMELKLRNGSSGPRDFVIAGPEGPADSRTTRLKRAGQKLGMPWLSWHVLKRAHEGLLEELRALLADELALEARGIPIESPPF